MQKEIPSYLEDFLLSLYNLVCSMIVVVMNLSSFLSLASALCALFLTYSWKVPPLVFSQCLSERLVMILICYIILCDTNPFDYPTISCCW